MKECNISNKWMMTLALLLLSALTYSAGAQSLVPATSGLSVATIDASGAILPIFTHYSSHSNEQTDVFSGLNSSGPYHLSWSGAHVDTETVAEDSKVLQRGTDYTIDWANGLIRFTTPIPKGSLVRVTYLCDNPGAVQNKTSAFLPIQYTFWKNGGSQFGISSLLKTDNGPSSTAGPKPYTALQFLGNTHFLPGADLSSGLYLDLHGSDWLKYSGLSLQTALQKKLGSLSLGFSRAGSQFAQNGAQGLTSGQQMLQALGELKPLSNMQINITARQTTQLVSTGGASHPGNSDTSGGSQQFLSGALAMKLPLNSSLNAGRTQNTTLNAQGVGTQTVQDNLQLNSSLAPHTTAVLNYNASAITNIEGRGAVPGAPVYSQTAGVNINSQLSPLLSMNGSFINQIGTSPADTQQLSLTSHPLGLKNPFQLNASMQNIYAPTGAARNRSLTFLLPLPKSKLNLSAGLQTLGNSTQNQTIGMLNIASQPTPGLQMSGQAQLRSMSGVNGAPNPTTLDTYGATMAYNPLPNLQLTGSYTNNPEINGIVQRSLQQQIGLKAQLGSLLFGGSLGFNSSFQSASSDTTSLNIGLHLTKWDTLTTGLQEQNTILGTSPGVRTYSLGFTHNFGSIFDLSLDGNITLHDPIGGIPSSQTDYSANAQIGIHF